MLFTPLIIAAFAFCASAELTISRPTAGETLFVSSHGTNDELVSKILITADRDENLSRNPVVEMRLYRHRKFLFFPFKSYVCSKMVKLIAIVTETTVSCDNANEETALRNGMFKESLLWNGSKPYLRDGKYEIKIKQGGQLLAKTPIFSILNLGTVFPMSFRSMLQGHYAINTSSIHVRYNYIQLKIDFFATHIGAIKSLDVVRRDVKTHAEIDRTTLNMRQVTQSLVVHFPADRFGNFYYELQTPRPSLLTPRSKSTIFRSRSFMRDTLMGFPKLFEKPKIDCNWGKTCQV